MSMKFDDDANDTKRQKRTHSAAITKNLLALFFDKNFPESNVFENKVTNNFISRNIFFSRSKFLVFPRCGVVCSVNLNYA